jgi:hypothetical protein
MVFTDGDEFPEFADPYCSGLYYESKVGDLEPDCGVDSSSVGGSDAGAWNRASAASAAAAVDSPVDPASSPSLSLSPSLGSASALASGSAMGSGAGASALDFSDLDISDLDLSDFPDLCVVSGVSERPGRSVWPSPPTVGFGDAGAGVGFPVGLVGPGDGGRERKRNKIKKGEGRDAEKDEWDDYDYLKGHFYCLLRNGGGSVPKSKQLFGVCKKVEEVMKSRGCELSERNRWAKRRIANAYAWLDRNVSQITDSDFLDCYHQTQG